MVARLLITKFRDKYFSYSQTKILLLDFSNKKLILLEFFKAVSLSISWRNIEKSNSKEKVLF